MTVRALTMIGAPTSAGAYGPGQERAPEVFRRNGLVDAMETKGIVVHDVGDVPGADWRPDPSNPNAQNVEEVAKVASALGEQVARALTQGHDVLVIGGDCTIELGTVVGAAADGAHVALAYIDLDADLNTPLTGDGVLDWMGVAHLLGVGDTDDRLTHIGATHPILRPETVTLLATDNITEPEQKIIDHLDLRTESLQQVRDDFDGVVARTLAWAGDFDRLLVHVDVDVLDFERFPIAENTDLRGGLEVAELAALMCGLASAPNWRTLTLTEVNPAHAPNERHAISTLVTVVVNALGARAGRNPDLSHA